MSLPQEVYKGHGTGNDFIVYIDRDGVQEPTGDEIRHVCDRHFGVGADGLLRLTKPEHVSDLSDRQIVQCRDDGAEWFMDYRNADGSLAEMCGNGTRVAALVAQRAGIAQETGDDSFKLGTRAGVKVLRSLGQVEPYGNDVFQVGLGGGGIGALDAYEVTVPGMAGTAAGTYVDMGNPHVVAVLEEGRTSLPAVEKLDLAVKPVVKPKIDTEQNVEFVRVDFCDVTQDFGRATMRVNERGCGETLSCGTGLGATAVTLRAKTGVSHWDIIIRGGLVHVDVSDDDVLLTGAAAIVAKVELL
ncbi:diaminopimelate epimerase [Bifidobacterium commune]|uniref:Diaminopimelate epimerase n=1 Tax=Bifidobacterium commune TaxID=1505727 RepID=A0A1C4GZL1_9BIFI|nr:diaminopimelate epimerase [Bifidobacterium commune]MBB2955239.1 diaminopimelate epimerase [Bifidobacterium commune]SCC78105.1 diaminopimelate epimerase [Bifidobacterium commune]